MNNQIPPYASYTYDHPNVLVSYPHRKRNKLVAELIIKLNASSWFDYGAGDGALLGVLAELQKLPENVVCYEPDPFMNSQLSENISKLRLKNETIENCSTLNVQHNRYEIVTVLEVLEHLPLPERINFYTFLADALTKNGQCLIEVPVEYGPVLLLKEWGRKFLKKRTSEYTISELLKAGLFGKIVDAHERYNIHDKRTFISPHHGFNLNNLINEIEALGKIKEITRSPFPILPRFLNQSILYSFKPDVREVSLIRNIIIKLNNNFV